MKDKQTHDVFIKKYFNLGSVAHFCFSQDLVF